MFHAVNMKHNKHHPESFETQPDFFSNSAPFFAVSASRNGLSSRNEAPRDPHRIQISSPAEVLAYIQCTLGFEPTNSLAAVAFANNKMSTVVRCDLPEALQHMLRSDTPESVTFMKVRNFSSSILADTLVNSWLESRRRVRVCSSI